VHAGNVSNRAPAAAAAPKLVDDKQNHQIFLLVWFSARFSGSLLESADSTTALVVEWHSTEHQALVQVNTQPISILAICICRS
jgi:hypothetical protein